MSSINNTDFNTDIAALKKASENTKNKIFAFNERAKSLKLSSDRIKAEMDAAVTRFEAVHRKMLNKNTLNLINRK